MATPAEFMLKDLQEKYADLQVDAVYTRLYADHGPSSRMFASFHQRLNDLFSFMNGKARTNRHYNADQSRSLIALFEEIESRVTRRQSRSFDRSG